MNSVAELRQLAACKALRCLSQIPDKLTTESLHCFSVSHASTPVTCISCSQGRLYSSQDWCPHKRSDLVCKWRQYFRAIQSTADTTSFDIRRHYRPVITIIIALSSFTCVLHVCHAMLPCLRSVYVCYMLVQFLITSAALMSSVMCIKLILRRLWNGSQHFRNKSSGCRLGQNIHVLESDPRLHTCRKCFSHESNLFRNAVSQYPALYI